jgi:hypothetical protein
MAATGFVLRPIKKIHLLIEDDISMDERWSSAEAMTRGVGGSLVARLKLS